MALNTSGAISLAGSTTGESIAIELGQSATGTIALNDTVVRDLAGVASGAITMPGDFWGKSSTIVGPFYYQGDNTNGEAGNNNRGFTGNSPIQGGGTKSDWVAICHGSVQSLPPALGIDDSGRLWSWGRNLYGGLGQNDQLNRSSPTQIGSSTNWESISTSCWNNSDRGSGAAVNSSGTPYAWGDNYFQQTNNWQRPTTTTAREPYSSPIQLGTGNIHQTFNSSITSVSKIFLSGRGTLVVKNNGTMYYAGANNQGAGGYNYSYADQAYEPVQVYSDFVEGSVATAGNFNGFFLRENGLLYSAGNPFYGAMGNNQSSGTLKSTPVQVLGSGYKTVRGINTGGMAIKTNGTLWAWGRNLEGICGQNNLVEYSSPVQIGSLTTWDKFFEGPAPEKTIGIIKTDGTMWATGLARRLDTALSNISYSSPVQLFATFTGYTVSMASGSDDRGSMILVD